MRPEDERLSAVQLYAQLGDDLARSLVPHGSYPTLLPISYSASGEPRTVIAGWRLQQASAALLSSHLYFLLEHLAA